jgi:hypothetical protein
MPDSGLEIDVNSRQPESPRREVGSLFPSELWWRDRYHDFEAQGYSLRQRYHPDWRPSWKESRKDFFAVEDGQATIVSILYLGTYTPNDFI